MRRTHQYDGSDRKEREPAVSRRDVLRTGATGLAITVGLAGFATPVAAKQGAIFDFFARNKGGKRDRLGQSFAALRAGFGRMFADAEKRTASESASETTTVFNQHADALVAYANEQIDASRTKESLDTIRLRFTGDETVERWIVADVDQGENVFVGARMTDVAPDQDVDEWVELEKLAVADAPDELERFVDEYAEPNEPVDDKYIGRLAGRYGPDVETSLMN